MMPTLPSTYELQAPLQMFLWTEEKRKQMAVISVVPCACFKSPVPMSSSGFLRLCRTGIAR